MADCIFCKIAAGEAPSEIVYQDEQVIAFRDINPVAPTHILIVPKKHLASVNEITAQDEMMIGHMFFIANQLAREEGIHETGYRLIINNGPHGGQVVDHLHLHMMGGQAMRHPMG